MNPVAKPFTPETLAERWGTSPNHVRTIIQNGGLQAFYIGRGIRITEEAVVAYEAREPVWSPLPCVVYVVRCEGFIKIGKASNVARRLAGMQSGSPFEISLVQVIECDGHAVEAQLHERFAEHRARGEWFRHEGAVAEWIAAGCPL